MIRTNLRSLVVLILVIGVFGLSIFDPSFRPIFGDLAKVGVGGYLGQLLPESR
ncbi:MAG: hypothetical protein WBF90_37850 [Rivularia sp. (in: cyanobacteria)]